VGLLLPMEDYRLIPLSDQRFRSIPAVLTPAKPAKRSTSFVVYSPTLPVDPDDEQDQEPIVFEEDEEALLQTNS
jgi:hypothetical protein